MESIRNAATAAANLVGLGGNTEETREGETSHIAGGEAPQNVATGTSQSGVEPVSGRLGRGEAGEPYDAGNVDGASGLGNTSSDYTSQSTTSHSTGTGLGSGLTGSTGLTGPSGNSGLTGSGLGSNTTSSYNTSSSSEPLSEKVRETFGVGGSNKQGTGLGGRNDDPGYGTASKRDNNSSLGSAVGHGSNPDTYAYNSKTAPGLGGHRIGDDFTSSNTRNEGRDSLPTNLGSDVAAGKSGGHSSSGGLTGRSDNDRYSSSTGGESLTQKAKDYLPGTDTSSHSSSQPDSARAAAREVISGSGRNDGYNSSSTYGSSNTSSLPVRSQESTLTGDRGLTGSSGIGSTGSSGLTGTGSSGLTSGLTGSSTTSSGLTGSHGHGHSHSHGLRDVVCEEEREGYVPHGGHPIGEAAHSTEDGKQTWLDYRNDPTLPVARAEPADR
ncbi:hypothetical protein M436DRAFT_69313 [Aureobasidium namibiae CBS 147.97]|uniref:Uncharacterized protein n=1 Tax=Aureobasidium namibiae CBS 147.97 TaxID=1043004 RepID=A0A074X378_9PEZI